MSFEGFDSAGEAMVLRPDAPLSLADLDDGELMARVATGDASAFSIVLERHQRPVIGYLVTLLSDREDALDGAQEVFVRAWTRASRYQPSGSFRAWLFRIATNVAIDFVRTRRRRLFGLSRRSRQRPALGPRPTAQDLELLPAPGQTVLGDMLDREREEMVQRAVRTLPAGYRTALVLRDLHELSYEEVAEVIGCRVGTVKSRVNRARNLLREKLADQLGDAP